MSAHVRLWRNPRRRWWWACIRRDCPEFHEGCELHPTHAEALAAAWEHIKEHS